MPVPDLCVPDLPLHSRLPMATRETPAARIERLLNAGDSEGALSAANELLAKAPNSFLGRFGRARAHIRLRNYIDAESDLEIARKLAPNDEHALLVHANMVMRLGRTDECIEGLRAVARGRGPHALEAAINLLQTYFDAGRFEEMESMVREGGVWTKDPRASLHRARVRALNDREAGITELIAVFRSSQPLILRRYAGFEAVGHLDKLARYREAFLLASEIHAATTGPLDMDPWLGLTAQQLKLFEKAVPHFQPRVDPVQAVAFVVAMPRSGTTLLEQMLDRHPDIGGIGEFDGLDLVCRTLAMQPNWPRLQAAVSTQVFRELQRRYLAGAHQIRKPGAKWTLDKSLRTWRALPEIAATFPGAVCINVDRDPRDVATSIFLSYFNPLTYEWTSSFSAIREVITCQRRVVPRAFEVLGLANERIVYEDLVEDPASDATRCLRRMGLRMDERVLSPELNLKAAVTLSREQVRQPIHQKSIGRWRNYEWAFDGSWDGIVGEHNARRRRQM